MEQPVVRYATTNGITIAYREYGPAGFPIILINGFASTMDMWNPPFVAELASRFRVIVFDNRGTGYSSDSDETFSIPLFATDTGALMDALHLPRAHVLGHSMGACITQELALAHPERIGRLVLISGTCGGERMIRMEPEVWEILTDKSGTPRDLANRMFSVLFPRAWLETHDPWQYCPEVHETTSEKNAARQAEALSAWPGSFDRLPGIRAPTLVITGTDDVVIPPGNSTALARRIPGAQLAEIAGAGHGLMYQCPEDIANAVTGFLQGR